MEGFQVATMEDVVGEIDILLLPRASFVHQFVLVLVHMS